MVLKVGVVGPGSVGTTLGSKLLQKGFPIRYGSRDPSSAKMQKLVEAQQGCAIDTPDSVCSWADVVLLTVPGSHSDDGIKQTASLLGPGIEGKVLIDATNPLSAFPSLEVRWEGKSGAEVLQDALPRTYVYKAFNTIGVEHMLHGEDGSSIPGWSGGQLAMLLAGSEEKQGVAKGIVEALGWQPAYVGPIRYARNLEAVAELWIHLGVPPAGLSKEQWGRGFHLQVIGARLE